jgi:hypothetical protein
MTWWKKHWPTSSRSQRPKRRNQIPATFQAERMPEPIDNWRIICYEDEDRSSVPRESWPPPP